MTISKVGSSVKQLPFGPDLHVHKILADGLNMRREAQSRRVWGVNVAVVVRKEMLPS
jgi:hypothetical protein